MTKDPGAKKKVWNSLEIAKLLVSLTVPVAVLLAGSVLSSGSAKQSAAHDEAMRKQTEEFQREERLHVKRAEIWDKVANSVSSMDKADQDLSDSLDWGNHEIYPRPTIAAYKKAVGQIEAAESIVDTNSPYFSDRLKFEFDYYADGASLIVAHMRDNGGRDLSTLLPKIAAH